MPLCAKDFDKLKRLRTTFDRNYRWTHLLSDLLSFAPEIITKEMVDALTEGTDFSKKEAVCALLSEVLSLHPEDSAEDRAILREYLQPAVRVYSADRYKNDAYVKKIAGRAVCAGKWSYETKTYPPYRAAVADDVDFLPDGLERMPLCFFDAPFSFFCVCEDGNEWMTLTPVDIDTSVEAIERARGKVVTFGLGLGYFAYMAARKESVCSVTVVEKSGEVIEAFKRAILPHFDCGDKIRIVQDDAFAYAENTMPKEHFDFAFVDTWRDAGDGLPMYLRMKPLEKLSPDTEFLYWIENFLLSRLRSAVFEDIWERESKAAHGSCGTVRFEDIEHRLSREGLRALAAEGKDEVLRIFLD